MMLCHLVDLFWVETPPTEQLAALLLMAFASSTACDLTLANLLHHPLRSTHASWACSKNIRCNTRGLHGCCCMTAVVLVGALILPVIGLTGLLPRWGLKSCSAARDEILLCAYIWQTSLTSKETPVQKTFARTWQTSQYFTDFFFSGRVRVCVRSGSSLDE